MKVNGDTLITHNDPPSDPLTVAEHLIDGTLEAAKRATEKAERAPDLARAAARETTRRWVWWVIAVAVVVPLAMTWAMISLFGRLSATEALVADQARQIDEFRSTWAAGNASLLAQGKPAVPPPDNPGNITDALVAAVVAQVRADLPAGMTRDDVQQIIDRTLLTRPPGPQGTGVTAIRPAPRGGHCVLVATLRNPGNGAVSESVSAPISPALCNPNAGQVTTTVAPTTTAPPPTPTAQPPTPKPTAPAPTTAPDDLPILPTIPN